MRGLRAKNLTGAAILGALLVSALLLTTLGLAPGDEKAQKIVVHLKHFSDDLHAAFMAIKLAGGMQAEGADVTIFVNLEGARFADARMPKDLLWGPSNKPISVYYEAFVKAGGKILVCPHCAKAAGMDTDQLRQGARVATEGEVVDLLLAADKILDY